MQQKSNKNSTAKDRLLQYLEYKGISQYAFSKKTGLSNGFLKSGSSISSENLKLLSNIFTDLNLLWVITGEGLMVSDTIERKNVYPDVYPNVYPIPRGGGGDKAHEKLTPNEDSDEKKGNPTATNPYRVTAIHPDPGKVYDSLPQEASQFNEPDVEYDPSLAHMQMPVVEPENVFSGLTQEEVDKELKDALRDALMGMFQSGEVYSAAVVREYQDQIKELAGQVARLEYRLRELGLTQIDGIWRHVRKTKENKGERGK